MLAGVDNFEAEAIFFFDNGQVIKEMLHVEFEAVLDGVVGMLEWKNQCHQAAYVSIGAGLRVQSVVLFTIEFDSQGHIPSHWNLPLRYLSSRANIGPDLGDGAIKVLAANDSIDPEYLKNLWDCGKGLVEVLTSIKYVVKRNKLSLYTDSGYSNFSSSLAMPHGLDAVQLSLQGIGNQSYLVANLESAFRDEQERIKTELEASHANALKKKHNENRLLQKKSATVARQKDILENASRQQIEVIVDKYRAKLRSQLAERDASWKEKFSELELSLFYAQEKEQQLSEQIKSVEESRTAACAEAVELFLQQLSSTGIELIVSQHGIGSHALKLHQVQTYMDNQTAFWAAQCGVSDARYVAWTAHYKRPVCQAGSSTDCECGTAVPRINLVRDFVIGESDMCHEHRFKRVEFY